LSKEERYIEDLFKEELKDYSLETTEADWSAIMDKYHGSSKKKRPFFWFLKGDGKKGFVFWFLAATIASVTFIGGYSIYNFTSKNAQVDAIGNTETIISDNIDQSNKDITSDNSNTGDIDQNITIDSDPGVNTNTVTDNTTANNTTADDNSSNVDDNPNRTADNNSNNTESLDGNSFDGTNTKDAVKLDRIDNTIDPTKVDLVNVEEGQNDNANLNNDNGVDNQNDGNDVVNNDKVGDNSDDGDLSNNKGEDFVKSEGETTNDVNDIDENVAVNDTTSEKVKSDDDIPLIPEPGISPWRFELVAGVMNSGSFITSSNSQYKSIRQNAESGTLTGNSGIRAYYGSGRTFFGTGLEKNTFSSNANFNYTRNIYDLVPVLNPNGDTIGYFKQNFRDTSMDFRSKNVINTFRLPIIFGYNIGDLRQGFRLKGILVTDYVTQVSGNTIEDKELAPVSLNRVVRENSLNIGLMGEFGYYRQIFGKMSLEVKGGLGTSISNFRSGAGDSKDRPWSYSIGLGLSYKL
jgi:hypothetical protein